VVEVRVTFAPARARGAWNWPRSGLPSTVDGADGDWRPRLARAWLAPVPRQRIEPGPWAAHARVGVRHEVAQLSVLRLWPGAPGMFLPDPTQACYRRADGGVRSPADNVPNRVRMVTGEPLRKSSPVKGQGRMIWGKHLNVRKRRQKQTSLRGLIGFRPLPSVCGMGTGCRFPNCLHGTSASPGVEDAPTSSRGSTARNVVTPPLRLVQRQASATARHAEGVAGRRDWKKRRLPGKPRDRACDMAQRQSR